ncbi:MAG TPA: YHS domain-containing protein [Tepidisphaeraceae bacterium]|nr:YHS domain-containing protein [Tepidisphaeraceae bacterium]
MKFALSLVCSLALATGVVIAADAKKDAKKPATQPTTQPSKPVNKFCAVEQEHDADPKVTYSWNGKTYAFCCKDCIDEFKKNPEKYKNAK